MIQFDRSLALGCLLLGVAVLLLFSGISLALVAEFNGGRSLTAELLALWSVPPAAVGTVMIIGRVS